MPNKTKKQNTKNVPELRFSGFNGEWEEKKIKNILRIGNGKDYKHLNNGSVPVFGTGGYMLSVDKKLGEGETIFIGRKGTINKPFYYRGSFWTVDTLFYTYDFNLCLPRFIYSIFQKINWLRYNEASGVPSLSKKTIENIKINVPQIKEQQKIADFLSSVDEWIENKKKEKEKLEEYKKGMMQKLFPGKGVSKPEIRFGGFDEEWKEKKLDDLLLHIVDNRGKTPPISKLGIPLIETNAIGSKKVNYKKIRKYVVEDTYKSWFRKYLEKKDILFSTVGQTALCSVFFGEIKSAVAQNIVGLRFDNQDNDFYYYLLTQNSNNNKFKRIEMIAVQPSIKVSEMIKIKFFVPNTKEQKKIANFLTSIDKSIDLKQQQITSAQNWKRGLMQRMFV